jgi:hypothetical protein
MPLSDLLQWIADARRSGTLSVALEFEERYLRFEAGHIVAYGSDDPMARDLGKLCVDRGLSADALEAAVAAHVESTVLGLFLWPDGRFHFSLPRAPTPEEEEWMPPEYHLSESIDTRAILMEGVHRLDEWKRIVKVLPSDDVQLHALGPAAELPILEEIAAHPEPPTLGELLAERGDERFTICRQLFVAFEAGLLAVEAGQDRDLKTARGTTTVAHLVRAAERLLDEKQHDEASALLRAALNLDPFRSDARALFEKVKDVQRRALYGAMHATAIVERNGRTDERRLPPRERRLYSLINGRWDVAALVATSGLGELETLRALRRLMHAGAVQLRKGA